jgi:hypothetical protein
MDRIVRISEQALIEALKLPVQERLRQANAAFRLYHALHRPYAKPEFRAGEVTRAVPPAGGGNGLRA